MIEFIYLITLLANAQGLNNAQVQDLYTRVAGILFDIEQGDDDMASAYALATMFVGMERKILLIKALRYTFSTFDLRMCKDIVDAAHDVRNARVRVATIEREVEERFGVLVA